MSWPLYPEQTAAPPQVAWWIAWARIVERARRGRAGSAWSKRMSGSVAWARSRASKPATNRYLYGLASYYEVLESEERVFSAQNTQVSIRLNRLLAYVQLYKALGGGWSVTDPESPPPASLTRSRASRRSTAPRLAPIRAWTA